MAFGLRRGPILSGSPLRKASGLGARHAGSRRRGGPFKEAARDTARRERRAWFHRLLWRLIDSLARHDDRTGGSADTGDGGS